MERTLNQEERIKRAEEIYSRRRSEYGNYNKRSYYTDNYKQNKEPINVKKRLQRKLIIQIISCLIIYLLIYVLLNSNYFFSEELHKKIMEYLTYDIQFSKLYDKANTYFINNKNQIDKLFNFNEQNKNTSNDNANNSETVNNVTEDNKVGTQNISVGGAEEIVSVPENKEEENDAQYIKKNYSIIWPLNGVITSKFGTRTPTDIITANHYGIDIAGNIGTAVISAMDGKVTVASTEGEYGKHIQIENGEITTLYAHCNSLLVNVGKEIKQGEKIAEVGETR